MVCTLIKSEYNYELLHNKGSVSLSLTEGYVFGSLYKHPVSKASVLHVFSKTTNLNI